jgi:hypothetical protein
VHDVRALRVEADVAAQVVIDALVGQRAQQDHQRQRGPQQRGAEDRDPVDEVERFQLAPDVARPGPLDPRAGGGDALDPAAVRLGRIC